MLKVSIVCIGNFLREFQQITKLTRKITRCVYLVNYKHVKMRRVTTLTTNKGTNHIEILKTD